jgi:alpha-glucosidase
MNQYRDFDNDPVHFSYSEGKRFLEQLHAGGRHYIPIVDAAIYHPNPNNNQDT